MLTMTIFFRYVYQHKSLTNVAPTESSVAAVCGLLQLADVLQILHLKSK